MPSRHSSHHHEHRHSSHDHHGSHDHGRHSSYERRHSHDLDYQERYKDDWEPSNRRYSKNNRLDYGSHIQDQEVNRLLSILEEDARRTSVETRREAYERGRRDSDRRRSQDYKEIEQTREPEPEPKRLSYDRNRYGRRDSEAKDSYSFLQDKCEKKRQYLFVYPRSHQVAPAPPPPPVVAPAPCAIVPSPCSQPPPPCGQPVQRPPPAVEYQPVAPPPDPCRKIVPPPKPCKKIAPPPPQKVAKKKSRYLISEGTGTSMAPLASKKPSMIPEIQQTSLYPLYPPDSIEMEPIRPQIIEENEIGKCENCRKGYMVRKFTWSGIVAAMFCFPCGIAACFYMRIWICSFCGERGDNPHYPDVQSTATMQPPGQNQPPKKKWWQRKNKVAPGGSPQGSQYMQGLNTNNRDSDMDNDNDYRRQEEPGPSLRKATDYEWVGR